MKFSFDLKSIPLTPIGIVASVAFAGIALVISIKSKKKLDQACDKLDCTVNELVSVGVDNIHIAQKVVDDAIDIQVKRRVDAMIPEALESGRREATREFNEEVRRAVNEAYTNIAGAVESKVMERVNKINLDDMTTLIVQNGADLLKRKMEGSVRDIEKGFRSDLEDELDDLKREAKEEFDDKIEELIDDFKDRMDDMVKIYSAVAGRVGAGKEYV